MTRQDYWHRQSSMQGTNTILKVMKQSASLTMIALPTNFGMSFVDVWQSSQTHIFFHHLDWTTRSFVDESRCNSQFLTTVTQMKHLSSSSTSCNTKYMAHTLHCAWSLTISSVLHEFHLSWGGLDSLLQTYASHYSPGYFFTSLSFLCCSTDSQRGCLEEGKIVAHNLLHFQAPFQEPIM
jgi:hypothetical protein